jgi:nucleolar protein 56
MTILTSTCTDNPTPKFGEALRAQVEERLNFFETGAPPSKNADAIRKVLDDLALEDDDEDADVDMPLTTLEPSPKKKEKKKKRKSDAMDVDEDEDDEEPSAKKVKLSKEEKKALKKAKKEAAKAEGVSTHGKRV